jgi:protein-disulfide isomerase
MTGSRLGQTAALASLALIACCATLFAMRSEIVEGNPSSPVRVVIYEDLQCGDCENLRTLLDTKLLPRYGSRVAFIHRDFPLGKHDWARPAAVAARWVYSQSPQLGITFRRELLAEHDHITVANLKPWLVEFAVRNKLDRDAIVACLTNPQLNAVVDQDYQGGVARDISHTPTVIVGGEKLVETVLYEDMARALDIELGHKQ